MKYIDLISAKQVYKNNLNVTDYLKKYLKVKNNNSEIIEIAYDLQAGSYIESAIKNRAYR